MSNRLHSKYKRQPVHRAKVIVFEFRIMFDDETIEGTVQMVFLDGSVWRQRHKSNNSLSCIKLNKSPNSQRNETETEWAAPAPCAHFRSNGIVWLDLPTIRFPCEFGGVFRWFNQFVWCLRWLVYHRDLYRQSFEYIVCVPMIVWWSYRSHTCTP